MTKNKAAVALGRKGGQKNTKAQKAARAANLVKAREKRHPKRGRK